MKGIKILTGLIIVLMLNVTCLAGVEYYKDPTGYAEGDQVELKVYIHELTDELRLKVQKIDGGDFWSDGRMRFYRDGQQIDTVLYYSGASYVDTEVPLDFTLERHEFRARADTFDGSGNQFWTGTVDVWGEWQPEDPQLTDHQAGDEFENEYYDENSSNPNVHVEEGSCIEVPVDSGEFDLHSDGSNIAYRFWRSPELSFVDINNSVSRVTLHSSVDPGTYYVTAYAGNGEGKIDSDTIEVVVYEPATPTPTPTMTPTRTPTPTPLPTDNIPDLVFLASKGPTGTGGLELHVSSSALGYSQFMINAGTALGYIDPRWGFLEVLDYNDDGYQDIAFLATNIITGTGGTELHVLDGSTSWSSFLMQTGTCIGYADPDSCFMQVLDFNFDGYMDIVLLASKGPTGTGGTEIHVLDGSTGWSSFIVNSGTCLHYVDPACAFMQVLDFNFDGYMDIVLLASKGPTGTGGTEIHVLDGSTGWSSFIVNSGTCLHYVDPACAFMQVLDYNDDGYQDIALIASKGPTGTGSTELHIMNGATSWSSFITNVGTCLHYIDPANGFLQLVPF